MGIWDFISAFFISRYLGWVVLVILVLMAIVEPLLGLYLFIGVAMIALWVYLNYKYRHVRNVEEYKAWEALSEEERAIWMEIRMKDDSGYTYNTTGRAAFEKRFEQVFSLRDFFKGRFEGKVPFPEFRELGEAVISNKGKKLLEGLVDETKL